VKTSLFYLPSLGSRTDIEAGMAGQRRDLYQQMLAELSEQARLADELGYDSISFTEHHFHIEGFEVSNNPVLLDLFVGLQTTRLRVGQLGIVLPASNPIRVAEDIAMLDHMTGGRANAGFARGYQRRWVDTMAQQTHGIHGALPHQHDAIDAANRAAFEENVRIIKQAWTQEIVNYQGHYWKVPTPGTPWDLDASKRYGRGIENDMVTGVGVVPKPLQQPHPPLFQPFASSERTVRWCAQENITPVLPPMHPTLEREMLEVFADESGRPVGQGIGVLRDVVMADSDQEALALWLDGPVFCGASWFAPFGFAKALEDPTTGQALDAQGLLEHGLAFVGTSDTVTAQVERLLARLPVQWVFAWQYNGLVPHSKLMASIERYATDVVPRVAEVEAS
jgi:alkanesulfonate monooxygenase SsuD/methylene tetrahydromethanopterin reductase-like flavin-dependent oxidoreductase (luciferase family)